MANNTFPPPHQLLRKTMTLRATGGPEGPKPRCRTCRNVDRARTRVSYTAMSGDRETPLGADRSRASEAPSETVGQQPHTNARARGEVFSISKTAILHQGNHTTTTLWLRQHVALDVTLVEHGCRRQPIAEVNKGVWRPNIIQASRPTKGRTTTVGT